MVESAGLLKMPNPDVVYYDFDNFRLDVAKQVLLKNGEPVLLTYKAFQTLQILVQNCGQIVEKENIYNSIWADSFVEEGNLTQYVYLLRKILDKNPSGVSYIETVARRGYIFTANVRKEYASARFKAVAHHSGTIKVTTHYNQALTSLSQEREEGPRSDFLPLRLVEDGKNGGAASETDGLRISRDARPAKHLFWRRPAAFLLGSIIIVLAVLIGLTAFYFRPDKTSLPTTPDISSLAVLPFRPIDAESNNARLGLGMAEAIITRLSKLKQIPVRPTSSIFRYADSPAPDLSETGRELGVDVILEGTVQRDGERIRISVQLVRVVDGKALWAERFDEKYTDNIFALQDSIAARVASSVVSELSPQDLKLVKKWPTQSTEAFEAYQMGVYFWNTRTKENLKKAENSFLKAIEIDSGFAQAFALLADTYLLSGYYGFIAPADRIENRTKASSAIARALTLDDSVAEAHIANAFLQFTPTGADIAKMSIERAIKLAPFNSTARLRHAWILLRLDDIDGAVREMRLAREYDPLSPTSNGALCGLLIYKEEFAEAVDVCRRSVEIEPHTANNRLSLAHALFFNGNTDEALAQAKLDVDEDRQKFAALGSMGFFYAKLGRKADAEAMIKQIKPQSDKISDLLLDLTLINYALGRRDESFTYFQQAYEKRRVQRLTFMRDPVWKDVREDERFVKLMRE